MIACGQGGPVAVTWGWLLVGLMSTLVALAMAEVASALAHRPLNRLFAESTHQPPKSTMSVPDVRSLRELSRQSALRAGPREHRFPSPRCREVIGASSFRAWSRIGNSALPKRKGRNLREDVSEGS